LKTVLTEQQLAVTIQRLSQQILENHLDLQDTVLIGIQPRGIYLSDRIVNQLKKELAPSSVFYGKLDITFYRDDVRKQLHVANKTDIPFSIENKQVIIIDECCTRAAPYVPRWTHCLILEDRQKLNSVYLSTEDLAVNYPYRQIILANQ